MAGSTSSSGAAAAAAFLSSLPEPLNQYAEAALPLTSSASDVETTAGRRIDELEISVRGHLLTLASALLNSHGGDAAEHMMMDTSDSSSALAAVLTCLRSTIDLCLHIVQLAEALDASDESSASPVPPACYKGMAHPVIRKLPFVLLEDTIDALPPSILKTIWTSGPTDWIADLAAAAASSSSGVVLFSSGLSRPASSASSSSSNIPSRLSLSLATPRGASPRGGASPGAAVGRSHVVSPSAL